GEQAPRHFTTYGIEAGGDEISGRRLLMWNNDVEISLCRPSGTMDYFFRNGEGDEVIFVHEGAGTLETIFGDVPYKEGDYIVIPRGTTYRFQNGGPQRHLVVESPGLIEIPQPYPNHYAHLMDPAPFSHPPIPPPPRPPPRRPSSARTATAATTSSRSACATGIRPTSSTTTRSTSSAGTATSIRGRSTSTTSSRSQGASTCRRPATRPSRDRTSSSARSARASSTSTRSRFRSRTTTRT